MPKHILGAVADPNEAPFNQAPVGTGAFKWGKRVAGDHVELVANTGYHGEGPFIEQLVFKYIPDMTVMYTQFRSGDIDIAGRAFITPDNYKEASRLPGPDGDAGARGLGRVDLPQPREAPVPRSRRARGAVHGDRPAGDHRHPVSRRGAHDRDLHAAAVLLLQVRTCRSTSSTSPAPPSCWTRPDGSPAPTASAPRTACGCRSTTPPPRAPICANRRSSSSSRPSPRSASR